MTDLNELWRRWDAGGRTDRALTELVVAAGPFLNGVLRTYTSAPAATATERQQEAAIGLLLAVRTYDPDRGVKFTSFATRKVQSAVLDGMRGRDRLSRPRRTRVKRLTQATEALTHRLRRAPTEAELASYLGWAPDEVADAQMDEISVAAAPLRDDADGGVGDAGPVTEDSFGYDVVRERVAWAMRQLDGPERAVMVLRYIVGLSTTEVAEAMGVSRSMVSRLRDQAAQQVVSLLRSR